MTNSEPSPVFIVGAPRSGTSLLRSILDAHPNVCCPTWETGVFDRLGSIVNGDVNVVMKREKEHFPLTRADLIAWCRRSVDDLMAMLTARVGKPRWGEKTPAHVFHMGLIHEVYPKAQFIHIIRDGRDAVRSLQNMSWAPREIRWSCRRWADSVRAGREAGHNLPAAQYREVRYEDLTAEPESTLRSLCEYLNEPFAPSMLEYHQPQNNSWGVAAAPIECNRKSNHRELSFLESMIFRRISGPMLRELGYKSMLAAACSPIAISLVL